jgi:general secretion pathway protein E
MENLETLVVKRGLVASDTMTRAKLVQGETGERLDLILTRLGLVSDQALANALTVETGFPLATADELAAAQRLDESISARFLRDCKAVPLRVTEEFAEIGFCNPLDHYPAEALAYALNRPIRSFVVRSSDVETVLDRLYGSREITTLNISESADEIDLERMKDLSSDAPVIRAVNRLISRAVEERASDIHIEPTEDNLCVRLRLDGVMTEIDPLPASMKTAFVARIKVMAGLNIAEKRLPQDGRLRLAVRGHEVDLRVATSPTIHGETVVLRILDRSHLALEFEALGFDAALLDIFVPVLHRPHGITLVTGPTGSGKTTTLYAALAALNTPDRKILTIEDPIEYRLAGTNQTQVNVPIGLDFASALRSFLRQDPDIMMVGEIRDLETAQVAVQAALTGHAILSTLHTNTAAGAVTRLVDMGVEPFLITSTLNAVLAQRLVRRLCNACREKNTPVSDDSGATLLALPLKTHLTYRAVGCAACNHTGFRGRLALLELLVLDEHIAKLVLERAEARVIHQAALAANMRPMLADGMVKVELGLTTLEEVLRVTMEN